MNQKELKKILAGLSITTLVAGASVIGFNPPTAQAA
jgi:radical SAM modification target selenobiotic family peptide